MGPESFPAHVYPQLRTTSGLIDSSTMGGRAMANSLFFVMGQHMCKVCQGVVAYSLGDAESRQEAVSTEGWDEGQKSAAAKYCADRPSKFHRTECKIVVAQLIEGVHARLRSLDVPVAARKMTLQSELSRLLQADPSIAAVFRHSSPSFSSSSSSSSSSSFANDPAPGHICKQLLACEVEQAQGGDATHGADGVAMPSSNQANTYDSQSKDALAQAWRLAQSIFAGGDSAVSENAASQLQTALQSQTDGECIQLNSMMRQLKVMKTFSSQQLYDASCYMCTAFTMVADPLGNPDARVCEKRGALIGSVAPENGLASAEKKCGSVEALLGGESGGTPASLLQVGSSRQIPPEITKLLQANALQLLNCNEASIKRSNLAKLSDRIACLQKALHERPDSHTEKSEGSALSAQQCSSLYKMLQHQVQLRVKQLSTVVGLPLDESATSVVTGAANYRRMVDRVYTQGEIPQNNIANLDALRSMDITPGAGFCIDIGLCSRKIEVQARAQVRRVFGSED